MVKFQIKDRWMILHLQNIGRLWSNRMFSKKTDQEAYLCPKIDQEVDISFFSAETSIENKRLFLHLVDNNHSVFTIHQ
jgi:hypothetical protein